MGKYQNISAFILAGGQSRRFGTDKAMASWKGRPMIAHIGNILAGCFESVAIVAKPDPSYRSLGYPVVVDIFSGHSPLVGIYSGLLYSETDWNFFTACDMPFLSCDVILRTAEALEEDGGLSEIIVPVTTGGLEPLAGFYNRSLVREIDQPGHFNMPLRTFIRSRNYKTVEFGTTKSFTNVNTLEQLAHIDR